MRTVRLADVIHVLQSDRGSSLVDTLAHRLEAGGADFENGLLGPLGQNPVIAERFEQAVSNTFFSYFVTRRDVRPALASAVTHVFAKTANRDGEIDLTKVDAMYGSGARALLLQIAELGASPNTRPSSKYQWMPDTVIEQVARSSRPDIAGRMPVLFELARATASADTLAGFRMMAVQHLFPSTRVLFDAFVACGLPKEHLIALGKNYSTIPDMLYGMRADGLQAPTLSLARMTWPTSDGGERDVSLAAQYLYNLFEGVDPQAADAPRFMLLDDGGAIIKALHADPNLRPYAPLCVAVEQTEYGARLAEQLGDQLLCPVVNVARSWLKKLFESPMIGESIAASVESSLRAIDVEVQPREATVVGYGAVGRATARALAARGYVVRVFDTDDAKMASARADGFDTPPRDEALARAHLLVSTTGKSAITSADHEKLPNHAVLVNGASGNSELGFEERALERDPLSYVDDDGYRVASYDGKTIRLGDSAGSDDTPHRVLRQGDKERLALRSGYVVNMFEDIPPELIQLTRALLFAGVIQASTAKGAGLVDLDDGMQQFIHRRLEKFLTKQGLSLEAPDFSDL